MPPTATKKFRVGVRNPTTHRLDFAFNIERREDGGIRITQIRKRLSDTHRHLLFSHFGIPKSATVGKKEGDMFLTQWQTEEPGTPIHFERSIASLPSPFFAMSDNYESYLRGR